VLAAMGVFHWRWLCNSGGCSGVVCSESGADLQKGGKKTTDENQMVKVAPTSDNEQLQEPKPKKMKVKMHDEINIAAKKIEANKIEGAHSLSKYGHMVKYMSKPVEEGPSGKPAKASQVQVAGGRKLKREGAIADIKVMYDQAHQSSKRLQQNDDNINKSGQVDIDDR
jgi:hypothetical protein